MKIDFHAHVLPGADHGCKSPIEAAKQLQLAKQAGIDMVVAVAHFYPHMDTVAEFKSRVQTACSMMNGYKDSSPAVIIGAEVLICEGIEHMPELSELSIGASNCILFEMPEVEWDYDLRKTLLRVKENRSWRAILAHPERYSKKDIAWALDTGIDLQLNVHSFYQVQTERIVKQMLSLEQVKALGSDIHGISRQYAFFSRVEKKYRTRFQEIMECSFDLIN